ncbi:MAG TPA: hypothetical protein VGF97_15665 [Rhizomicrobium sp.]|jgi:hypothetical protein
MANTPVFLLAPAANMNFASLPSGATYLSDANALIVVSNGSAADQLALVAAGCVTLNPIAGGGVNVQPGTAYAVAATDQNDLLLFTSAAAVAVTLPATMPVGFSVELVQVGTGLVTASAASGATLVSPGGLFATTGQYFSLICVVIANATSANAIWDIITAPQQNTAGNIGAQTLSALYAQDTANHYAQYTNATVYNDGTSANDGTWLKTGTGNGSGNWTQVSSFTLASLNASLSATNASLTGEVARAQSSEAAIIGQIAANAPAMWADDGNIFAGGWFDSSGNPVLALTAGGRLLGSVGDMIPAPGFLWADEPAFAYAAGTGSGNASSPNATFLSAGNGVMPIVDGSANIVLPYGAAPSALDDYCPYVAKADGSLRATNNAPARAGLDLFIASTRGNPATGGISGVHQMGPVVKFMDDATASGNAPLHERRQFDYRAGAWLAGLGGITRLVHVIDLGHSLTIGGSAGLLTTSPPFSRGAMFNGGPKVNQMVGNAWNAPPPITDDAQLQALQPYCEFQVSGGQGATHGGGIMQWFSAGNIGGTEAALFCSVGAGGAILTNLLSGTPMFSDLVRAAERSAAIAAFNGWAWECCVACSIGENDYLTYATNASGFQSNLLALQAAIEGAIQGIFASQGWSAPAHVPLICEQPSSWTDSVYNLATCALAYVFPALARSNPNQFKLVGPEYYTANYSAGGGATSIHKTAHGYKLDGQYIARAVQKIRAAAPVPGLYVTGVSNSGTTLTITTNATSNLAIDTSVVSDPNGQSGLRVLDVTGGNANIALSSVAVSATTITAMLASHTSGHQYMLGVGDSGTAGNLPGPTTGPRTTIRDSSADVSSTDTGTTPMFNYLSHDQVTWTAA